MKENRGAGDGSRIETVEISSRQNWGSWLLVALCSAIIFATIPVARSAQKFVYNTVGKEFFTYFVVLAVITGTALLLYFFVFKLKVKQRSQYIWILICAGLYLYNTFRIDKHPEEAIHFLEYGILSYFIFRALSYSVRDTTVYISALLIASFVGTMDEFLQWIMPNRFWDFRDIGLNIFASSVLLLGIWKGIRPKIINKPIKKISLKILAGIFTVNLLFIGLCLSNTPDNVKQYTAAVEILSWLRNEETMTEITSFDIGIVWVVISITLSLVWITYGIWMRYKIKD